MTATIVPPSLMRERTVSWSLKASTIGPGQTASGAFYLSRLDGGGQWRATWTDVNLRTPDHVRAWRAIAAIAESGVTPLIVPQCDRRHFPAPVVDGRPLYSYGAVPHSDGTLFDDGSGYDQSVVVASTVGSAALRATSLVIHFSTNSALRGGEAFSIEHPTQGHHRYEIKTVTLDGSGDSVITFRPPLREAVAAATAVEFDQPKCVMTLARPDAMDLTLELRRFGTPSVVFDEYIYPST